MMEGTVRAASDPVMRLTLPEAKERDRGALTRPHERLGRVSRE